MQKYKNFSKFVQFIFWKFYVMKDLFGRFLLQNWDVSYFLCHRFSFCHRIRSLSVKIGTKLLFHTCFHIKISIFFESVAFKLNTTCTEQELYFRIGANSARHLLRKIRILLFRVLCFVVVYFSSEALLQGMSKNNPTKNQINVKIQVPLKHSPAWKLTEEKMLWRLSDPITSTNYNL